MDKEIDKKGTIAVRQQKEKEAILEQLRRIPIVQVACEKSRVSRATFYRLRAEDRDFKTSIEEALAEGVEFLNDMSESQTVSLIKDKHWPAISFWLRARHPAYRTRIDVNAHVTAIIDKLTPEQEAEIERAMKLASLVEGAEQKDIIRNNNNHGQSISESNNQS